MRFFADQRFLAIYSGILTIVFAVTVLCGFAALRNQSFDQLTVHRINFVEPDGTPRLIISDRAEFPGAFMRGKEYPRPDRRDAAGMLFMNDEASEMGGLIWGWAERQRRQNPKSRPSKFRSVRAGSDFCD